jgi:hypothetical protein
MRRKPVLLWALGISVLLRLDPVEVVVYLDGVPDARSINAIVTEAACPYIQAEEVPLPLPYTVRVIKRAGESQRFLPESSPIASGLITKCQAAGQTAHKEP